MLFKLVKKQAEAKDTVSFFFLPSEKFTWQAGQYAYITLGGITKQFTIASSPTEELIQVTTRIRKESVFKQALDSLKIGEEIEARAPFGSFVLTNHYSLDTSHLFLAGGIGITPFRSMIKYNVDKSLEIPIHLVYSHSDSDFVFKKELDQWQKENDNIKIKYIDTSVLGRIDKSKIEKLIGKFHDQGSWKLVIGNCTFSAVGPTAFVNAMEDILEKLKIPEDHIKTEKFIGY